MFDYAITAQAIADYNADMLEMGEYIPTAEELDEMYADAKARGLAE